MEPLSPKLLNIQIICMRKEVKKAVVHQIHGLTQKANKLRIKKGTDEQKKKNALKAENYVYEIKILKKLKTDEVSLFALSNTSVSDLRALIAKPVISPEGKAMAKLCLRPNMQNAVNDFISKYSDSLELLNNLISDRYNKNQKTNKKNKKKKKVKKKSSKDGKKEPKRDGAKQSDTKDLSDDSDRIPRLIPISATLSTEENSPEILDNSNVSESDIENFSIDNDVGDDIIASGSEDPASKSSDEEERESEDEDIDKSLKRSTKQKKVIDVREINFTNKDRLSQNKPEPEEKATHNNRILDRDSNNFKIKRKKLDPLFKSSDDRQINLTNEDRLNQNKPQAEMKSTENNYILKPHSNILKTERKKVDPFFKTSDDSEYFTYCDVETKATAEKGTESNFHDFKQDEENKDSFKSGFCNNNLSKKNLNSDNYFQRNSGNSFSRNFKEKAMNKGSFSGLKPLNRQEKRRHLNLNNKNRPYNSRDTGRNPRNDVSKIHLGKAEQEVKLHPSWEAKKKLNQPPVPFQGKKIVFDD